MANGSVTERDAILIEVADHPSMGGALRHSLLGSCDDAPWRFNE